MTKRMLILLLVFWALPLVAQPQPASYGTRNITYVPLSYFDFRTFDQGVGTIVRPTAAMYFAPGEEGTYLSAPLHLPSGVLLTDVEVDTCHLPNEGLEVFLVALEPPLTNAPAYLLDQVASSGNNGCELIHFNVVPQHTVNNAWEAYAVFVRGIPPFSVNNTVGTIRVGYKLQVSLPPASASFTDVPTSHPFFQYIEALKAAGITDGCTATEYCPNAFVTRSQVAKFLSVALGLNWSDN